MPVRIEQDAPDVRHDSVLVRAVLVSHPDDAAVQNADLLAAGVDGSRKRICVFHVFSSVSYGMFRRICHAPRRYGDAASRLWRGCHSSAVPVAVHRRAAPKSSGAREQVPLSPALSLRNWLAKAVFGAALIAQAYAVIAPCPTSLTVSGHAGSVLAVPCIQL